MSSAGITSSSPHQPSRWGLSAKLFTTLVLLGVTAVLVTGVLGYFRAREALEKAVFDQLTAARQTKTRQVETYFRTIQAELRLLATSKMVVDATREFRIAVDQLDRTGASPELRQKVGDWYAANFIPQMTRILGREPALSDYLPVGGAPYYLQYHYIVENPNPGERRKLLDDAGDGSDYSRLHAVYHPLMRAAAATVGFFDFMVADPKSGRLIYTVQKEVGFHHLPPIRSLPALQRRRRRRPLRGKRRPVDRLPRGFRPLRAVGRRTHRVHGSTGDRPGRRHRCADRAIVERGDRQRRHRRPPLAAGGIWRHGRGLPRRARSSGALGPARVLREPAGLFRRTEVVGTSEEEIAAIQRYGTPVLHQAIDTTATRAALAGVDGTGEIIGYRGVPTLASWGPLAIADVNWASRRQGRQRRGLRADRPAAPRPAASSAGWRCLWWRPPPRGFRARCSDRCAS